MNLVAILRSHMAVALAVEMDRMFVEGLGEETHRAQRITEGAKRLKVKSPALKANWEPK